VYEVIQPRLIYGENVADALRIARSGNADVGLVALSLAIAEGTPYQLVPDTLHAPIRQTLVVTSTGAPARAAATFAQYLSSDPGRRIMADFGFETP
jgi:molybdate transport system substrate-binding protein